MSEVLQSFAPVVSQNSQILILGSMPGAESLRMQQYYAHRRNQFWKILFDLFEEDYVESYSERINFLTDHRVAVWDVFKYCERKGSLDQNIRNEILNDFPSFLSLYEGIVKIYCNGRKSYESFRRNYPELAEKYLCEALPSTSPAYVMKYGEKLEKWAVLKEYLS
ncbi:DNA-deoxyinosine glycosylase [Spirochaeta isovalerica]|uniref:TDG/mug DNA glycosylase family protein n=1 Tax=Spirochaeta isovalerica TaxID=150 RepID=A0A841RIL8_9SPIO|nr:DNA-deoxyinosine glycosylase [Spirochaeta isovalerica]MBB6482579.1 TDG/mug DNA glycosylase family protein [Spirochaeta isovalerica]